MVDTLVQANVPRLSRLEVWVGDIPSRVPVAFNAHGSTGHT